MQRYAKLKKIRMRKAMTATIALILCAATGPSNPPAKSRWVYTYNLQVDEVNGGAPEKPEIERHRESICQGPMTTQDAKALLGDGLIEGCHFYQFHLADGAISFTGICPPDADGVTYDLDADGTYNEKALLINFHARGVADGDHILASGRVTGVRVGGC